MKKTHPFIFSFYFKALFFSLFLFSCSSASDEVLNENSDPPAPTPDPIVYVAGYEDNAPKLWRDNIPSTLPLTYYTLSTNIGAAAGSVFVVGNDVYVYGVQMTNSYISATSGTSTAIAWKNGRIIKTRIGSRNEGHYPQFATETNYYHIINEYNNGPQTLTPSLYGSEANLNVGIPLTDPTLIPYSWVSSMFVESNNIYAVLNQPGSGPCTINLLKNGQLTRITNGLYYAEAFSLFVKNNDVYIAGRENGDSNSPNWNEKAMIWKNGTPIPLASGSYESGYSYATSVFVTDNGDIHVTGNRRGQQDAHLLPRYWKNGNESNLTNGQFHGSAKSIYVHGNDVYIAGYEENANGIKVAKIWKNGIATSLTDGTKDAEALSVFVK